MYRNYQKITLQARFFLMCTAVDLTKITTTIATFSVCWARDKLPHYGAVMIYALRSSSAALLFLSCLAGVAGKRASWTCAAVQGCDPFG